MSIKLKNSDVLDLFDVMNKIIAELDETKQRISDVKIEYWFLRIFKKIQSQYEIIMEIRNNYVKELGVLKENEQHYEIIDEKNKKEFADRLEILKNEECELTGVYKKDATEVFSSLPVSVSLKYFLMPLLEETEI